MLTKYAASFIFGLFGFVLLPYTESTAQLSRGEKDTIFIGVIKVDPAVEASIKRAGQSLELEQVVQGLRGYLTTELNQSHVFQLVERERKEDIELEQAFAEVAVDPNDKNRAKSLAMAGAKYAFLPTIHGFEDARSTTRFEAIGRSSLSRSVWISASVIIVDSSTGASLTESPSVEVKGSQAVEYTRQGSALGGNELLSKLAKELAKKLSQESISLLRPAKVLTISGEQIMINRGASAGFTDGVHVEFYATEDVTDDDTGEIFKNEVLVGQGTVMRSNPKQSFVVPAGENLGIAKGCVVKIKKAVVEPIKVKKKQAPALVSSGSDEKPLNFQ